MTIEALKIMANHAELCAESAEASAAEHRGRAAAFRWLAGAGDRVNAAILEVDDATRRLTLADRAVADALEAQSIAQGARDAAVEGYREARDFLNHLKTDHVVSLCDTCRAAAEAAGVPL